MKPDIRRVKEPFDEVEDLVECLLGLAGAEKDVGKVVAGLVVIGIGLQLGAPLGHLGLQILRAAAALVRQLRPQLHGRDGLSHRGIVQLGLVLVLKSNNNQLESALQQHYSSTAAAQPNQANGP
jgi:hypothetical protein